MLVSGSGKQVCIFVVCDCFSCVVLYKKNADWFQSASLNKKVAFEPKTPGVTMRRRKGPKNWEGFPHMGRICFFVGEKWLCTAYRVS